jgi:hypothetical protein
MRPDCVVEIYPPVCQYFCFPQISKHLAVQKLIPHPAVKFSQYPFSHGDPGSIYAVDTSISLSHFRSSSAINSGPLSLLMYSGHPLVVIICDNAYIQVQDHVDWRGLIVPSLPFPIYRKFRIRGTNGLAARPKCGCELSPRPYFFSADRLCEGEATEKENSPGTLISRLFLSADSRT